MTDKKKPSRKKGCYEVGYGKPPKHSRFKKGESGNCKGRPKGAVNKASDNSLYALIDKEATRMVSVVNGDQKLTLSMAQLVIRTLSQLAAKGNTRAMAMFLEHLKVIYEKQLSEETRVGKMRAGQVDAALDSLTHEQLEYFLEQIGEVKKARPSSSLPTQRARPSALTGPAPVDQST